MSKTIDGTLRRSLKPRVTSAQRDCRNSLWPRRRLHGTVRADLAGRCPLSVTRLDVHRIAISPPRQHISSFEVSSTRLCSPESWSMFSLIEVRDDEWKGAGVSERTNGVGRRVCMDTNCAFFSLSQRDMTAQMICRGMHR